jgi:hypothetical protein
VFCPKGYVSASKASVNFDEWGRFLIQQSILHDDPLKLSEMDQLDISRYCMNFSYSHIGIFLGQCESLSICGFDGTLLNIDDLYFLANADDMWRAEWFPDDLKFNELRHLFIDTGKFVVTAEHWSHLFSKIWKENNYEDWAHLQNISNTIKKFEGWAVCISEEDEDRSASFLAAFLGLPSRILEDALSNGVAYDKRQGPGRAGLRKAKAAYAEMGNNRGDLSREQMARKLESLTGEKPSAKTMRDWEQNQTEVTPPREN